MIFSTTCVPESHLRRLESVIGVCNYNGLINANNSGYYIIHFHQVFTIVFLVPENSYLV